MAHTGVVLSQLDVEELVDADEWVLEAGKY